MKYFIVIIVFVSTIILPTTAAAQTTTIVNPAQFVVDIYNIALLLGGFLAFGAVVYGAVSYSIAAGNPSAQTEAKEWITQALLGLALLFGAYLILQTIGSGLTGDLSIKTPPLNPVGVDTNGMNCVNTPKCRWTPPNPVTSGCAQYEDACNHEHQLPGCPAFTVTHLTGQTVQQCTPPKPKTTP